MSDGEIRIELVGNDPFPKTPHYSENKHLRLIASGLLCGGAATDTAGEAAAPPQSEPDGWDEWFQEITERVDATIARMERTIEDIRGAA